MRQPTVPSLTMLAQSGYGELKSTLERPDLVNILCLFLPLETALSILAHVQYPWTLVEGHSEYFFQAPIA